MKRFLKKYQYFIGFILLQLLTVASQYVLAQCPDPDRDATFHTYTIDNVTCLGGNDGSLEVTFNDYSGTPYSSVMLLELDAGLVDIQFDVGANVTFSNLPEGQYFLRVRGADNCDVFVAVSLLGDPQLIIKRDIVINPDISSSDADSTICLNDPVTFTASPAGADNYDFFVNGISVQNGPGNLYTTSSLADNDDVSVEVAIGPCTELSPVINMTVNQPAMADANVDQSVCELDVVNLDGNISGSATSSTWSSSGDGTFDNPSSLTAIYTPGSGDISAGTVDLTLTTDDPAGPCTAMSDVMTVSFVPPATADANADQTICEGDVVNLNGSIGGLATSSVWSSSGDGTFDDATLLTAVYTPGPGDTAAGTVDLTLTTDDPPGSCSAANDAMTVTINQPAIADANVDQTICEEEVVNLNGSIGGSATSSTWSSSGDGTFDDATSLSAIYTPGPTDIAVGLVNLTLTSDDPAGPCPTANDEMIVTINPLPAGAISNSGPICVGNQVDLIFTATMGTGPYEIIVDGNTYSPVSDGDVFATLTEGTDFTGTTSFELTSITDLGVTPNCAVSLSMSNNTTVTVNPLPDGTISNSGPVCAGNMVDLTFTATSGSGPFDIIVNGTLFNGVNDGDVFAQLTEGSDFNGTTAFELTSITDQGISSNCTATVSNITTVSVHSLPDATINPAGPFCIDNPAVNLVAATGGGNWSGIGITDMTTGTFDPAVAGAGVHPVIYEVTDGNGCTNSDTMDISVNPLPTGNISNGDPVCVDGTMDLIFTSTTGTGPFDIVVDGNTYHSIASGDVFITLTEGIDFSGNTNFLLTSITDLGVNPNCANVVSDTAKIEVNSRPDPIINGLTTVCFGTTMPYSTDSGKSNYMWNVTGGTVMHGGDINDDSVVVNWDGNPPYEVSVNYENAEGCSAITPYILPINVISTQNLFQFSVTKTNPSCSGDDGELEISVTGGSGDYTYQLFLPDSSVLSNQTGIFNNLIPGNYMYLVTDDSTGCSSDVKNINLIDISPITATADTSSFENSLCYGQSGGRAIINVTGGSGTYEYSYDGTNWVTFSSGNYIENLPPNGTYIILVRESSASLCYEQVTVTIANEYPPLIFTYSITDASCDNNDGTLKIESVSGGLGPYEISFQSGPFNPVDLNNLPVFSNLSGGIKDVRIRDTNECIREESQIKIDVPASLNADIQTFAPTCNGNGKDGKISFYVDSNTNSVAPPYEFGLAPDNIPPDQVIMMPLQPDYTITIDTLTNGLYYILLNSPNGCESRTDITISGGPEYIDFDIVEVANAACKGGTGSVFIDQINGDPAYDYMLSLVSLPSNTVVYSETFASEDVANGILIDGSLTNDIGPGIYQIRLSQDQNGCNLIHVSDSFTIGEPDGVLDFEVTDKKTSYPDYPTGSISIRVNTTGGDPYETSIETKISYFPAQEIFRDWDFVIQNSQNPALFEFTYEDLFSGIYNLSVRDQNGCEITKEVSLDFDTAIFIPNIFTPNNDSHNDVFYIRNLPDSGTGTSLIITNRWGKVVYQSNDYYEGNFWDGGNNPDGTYFYKLNIPGKGTYNGWVEIERGSER